MNTCLLDVPFHKLLSHNIDMTFSWSSIKTNLILPLILKIWAIPLVPKIWATPLFRKTFTYNYTSGKIALGEKHSYLRADPSWIILDIEDADFNIDFGSLAPFPFEADTQDVIYSSHCIEHIPNETILYWLRESYRILKPGGYIRLEAPDTEKIIAAYKNNDQNFLKYFSDKNRVALVEKRGFPDIYGEDHVAVLGFLSCYQENIPGHIPVIAEKNEVDSRLRSLSLEEFCQWSVALQTEEQKSSRGHCNPIYYEKVHQLLSKIGFRDIKKMSNRETEIPKVNISGIERRGRSFYSLYVEAKK
jgi:SAM-dependent methyltransferase